MENERYTDKTYVGAGGMAQVYKAYDKDLERNVAIKELSEQLRDNEDIRRMFLAEARKMAQVAHQNVVQVYDIIDGEVPTIMMEYMGGGSLATRMGASALPPSTVLPILEQVIRGLQAIHDAGLIHRDVKPENILEQGGKYKITDFGVAMSGEEETLPFVTNKYAAPEVLTDPSKIQPSSDIYSLGIMAIELLLGTRRFEEVVKEALESDSEELQLSAIKGSAHAFWQQWVGGTAVLPPLNTIDDSISEDLSKFLCKLTARNPADRPQDCASLIAELGQLKEDEGLRASAHTEYSPKMKRQMDKSKAEAAKIGGEKKKQPMWFKLVVGAGIAILLAFTWLLMLPSQMELELVTTPPGASFSVNGEALESAITPASFQSEWGDVLNIQTQNGESIEVVLSPDMEGITPIETGARLEIQLPVPPPAMVSIMNSEEAAAYFRKVLPEDRVLSVALDDVLAGETGYSVEVNTPLNYQIEASHPGHLLALHLGSDDVLTLVYPNPRGMAPRLSEAGSVSLGKELDLMATEPLGKEWMVFVVVDELPTPPIIRGAESSGAWSLRYPFGGQDSPGRDMVLWLSELATSSAASAAMIQVEVVYRLDES